MLTNLSIGFWNIINLVSGTIDWIIFFLVIHLVGKRKISNIRYIFTTIIIFIFMAYINVIKVFPNIKIFLCMVIGISFYITSYEDKIYKSIIVSLLFWLGLMVAEGSAVGLVVFINKLNNINITQHENLFRIQAIIMSKVFLFIGFILFKYFKLSLDFKPKDMILIGIPILSNIVSLLLIFEYNLRVKTITTENLFIFIFAILLILSSSIILLIVIGKIVQDDKLNLEYELINERIKTNYRNYENINEVHDKLKYVYHDLKNHMICIKNYDTKEEIISYINNLEFQISEFENFKNTGNKTLDLILAEKISICKKHNIQIEDNINISKLNFIKNNDICSIFANSLDNAIEACMDIDNELEKRIEVKATYINKFAIIKFINTKANDIKLIDEHIQTSKGDDKIHGIGLASIKYIVNKYGGETIVNYSDNEFILKIMIPIKS
ncbi:sensor histidine kinase virs; sensor histidine kinase virs [Clostridioides difficile]|uniref:ATP-binding protein n=1 Tax=Clostridioides difficile TaxID=1496 RepID=UPI000D1E2443|nr:sensor histidine kinase [Clostridioides difficile]EGT2202973.1 GHKL domain-containing protein [Clostridioides difficile]EGT4666313.1 ATP-binding protein [Clostridioides difficile]UUC42014.1 GHKL domain-containing protein [Clostridioides difficile]VFC57126.1 sensor histidine kinase virs; sensor histidine kinase virs [Clostridioides difficile]VHX76116.1 sensor histidine kinase virs; sensor histidine kinase virs [Clostridioides difficile]